MQIQRRSAVLGAAVLGLALVACLETGVGPSDEGLRRILPSLAKASSGKMPKELWVTSQGGNVIYIRDFKKLSPIDQIDLPRATPSGAGPHIVTFHTPDFAYVAG